jgi:hypothetical protein
MIFAVQFQNTTRPWERSHQRLINTRNLQCFCANADQSAEGHLLISVNSRALESDHLHQELSFSAEDLRQYDRLMRQTQRVIGENRSFRFLVEHFLL